MQQLILNMNYQPDATLDRDLSRFIVLIKPIFQDADILQLPIANEITDRTATRNQKKRFYI
jgi:hypothetical protein